MKTDNSGDNVDDDDIWAQTSQFDLTRLKKDTTNPETYVLFATYYRLSFARLKKKKVTDGSRTEERVAVAANRTLVGFRTTVLYSPMN